MTIDRDSAIAAARDLVEHPSVTLSYVGHTRPDVVWENRCYVVRESGRITTTHLETDGWADDYAALRLQDYLDLEDYFWDGGESDVDGFAAQLLKDAEFVLRREEDLDDELAIDDALFDVDDWCKAYAQKSGKSALADTAKLKVDGYSEWRCLVTIDGVTHTLVCKYEDGISLE